jgi:hypothetical protein
MKPYFKWEAAFFAKVNRKMSVDDTMLSDYRLSRSNLYDLLAGVVGKLNDMEAKQTELMRLNGDLRTEVNQLKSDVSVHKNTIASMCAQSMILEGKVSNISYSIQGYTADVEPGVEAVRSDIELPERRSSTKRMKNGSEASSTEESKAANNVSPVAISEGAMGGGVQPPIKGGKLLLQKWRHAARRAVLLSKLGKLFKVIVMYLLYF